MRSAHVWMIAALVLTPGAPIGLALLFWLADVDLDSRPAVLALLYSSLATGIVFTSFGYGAGRLMDRLRSAALHDGLTGLFNRRFLRESLPPLQAGAVRRHSPLCVVMLDLDLFKLVNDCHGHLVGDQTLAAVGRTLREHSRRSDLVARYGGEEFAVLCPDTDAKTGLEVAERLRKAVAALGPEQLGHPGRQTISVGVAVQSPEHELSPEQLLDHADLALYRAKDRGRNQTVVWIEEPRAASNSAQPDQ